MEIFADIMTEQFKSPDTRTRIDEVVYESIKQHNETLHGKTLYFTPGEISNIICKLPKKSSPGIYKISNSALKHGGKKLAIYLCQIFNSSMRNEYFPKQWKEVAVVMIPKPGNQ